MLFGILFWVDDLISALILSEMGYFLGVYFKQYLEANNPGLYMK